MSAFDSKIENEVNKCASYAIRIVQQLEEKHGIKIDDNHKAQLIGQLAISASIQSLIVHADSKAENFAVQFFQQMIKSGVAQALTSK